MKIVAKVMSSFMLVFIFSVTSVFADSGFKVGVKSGDWVKFDVTVTPSDDLASKWFRMEFLSVEGTVAYVRMTTHLPNGTDLFEEDYFNMSSTDGEGLWQGYVISANSSAGDSVYLGYEAKINGETTGSYAGANRTIIYVSLSSDLNDTYYWDKETGVLTEYVSLQNGKTVNIKLTSTNLWGQGLSLFDLWPSLIMILVATVVVFAAVFMRHKKPTAGKSRSKSKAKSFQKVRQFAFYHEVF
ncbi:hypothetical protein MUO74_01580 [Candidatus Bathyarchaeota archaeon]|nr:hypothetical protein [Candidatus Bathyarchaeota archaeon]